MAGRRAGGGREAEEAGATLPFAFAAVAAAAAEGGGALPSFGASFLSTSSDEASSFFLPVVCARGGEFWGGRGRGNKRK